MSSQFLNSTLHDIRNLEDLYTKLTGPKGTAMISLHAATDMELELLVTTAATQEGVFTVGLTSSAPILNGTNATVPLNHTAPSNATFSSGFAVPSDKTVTNGTLPYVWLSSVTRSHSSTTSPFTVGATSPDHSFDTITTSRNPIGSSDHILTSTNENHIASVTVMCVPYLVI